MNRLLIAFVCAALFISTGCYFGDPSAVEVVWLKVPVATGQSRTNLSASDAGVQEALKQIDAVLVSNGLTRVPHAKARSPDGSLVHYQGPPTRGCSVSLKDNQLVVVFVEFGRRGSTDPVKKICGALEKELSKQYGAKNVRIE